MKELKGQRPAVWMERVGVFPQRDEETLGPVLGGDRVSGEMQQQAVDHVPEAIDAFHHGGLVTGQDTAMEPSLLEVLPGKRWAARSRHLRFRHL